MYVILEVVHICIYITIVYLFFYCYFQAKPIKILKAQKISTLLQIMAIISIIILRGSLPSIVTYGMLYMISNIGTYFLLVFGIGNLLFFGSKTTKSLLTFMTLILLFFFEYFMYMIFQALFGHNYFDSSVEITHYAGTFASSFIELFAVLLLVKLRNKKEVVKSRDNFHLLQIMIPFLSCLFFIFFPIFTSKDGRPMDTEYFGILFLFVIINFVNYIIFEHYQKVLKENYENLLLTQEYAHRDEYYKRMEQHQQDIRIIKHDLKNQLLAIHGGLDSFDKTSEQIEGIIQEVSKQERETLTQNIGLNILLCAKLKRAKESGIDCDFDIKVPKSMTFEQRDLGSLVGNVLDNAIEACLLCKRKLYIKFSILYYNHSLILTCENPTDGKVKNLHTRKRLVQEHGFGSISILSITNKYNGNMEYTIKDAKFSLELTLWEPIKITKNSL